MKFNKFLITAFTIGSLLIPSYTALASINIKNNAPCKTKNQIVLVKQTTYKCVSVNKKLVWRTIKSAPVARPIVISPTQPAILNKFQPWSEKFELNQMIDTAYENFSNWKNLNTVSGGVHKSLIQDGSPLDIVNVMKSSHFFAVDAFQKYAPPKTVMILGTSTEWVINSSKNTFMGQVEYPNNSGHICYPPNGNVVIACASSNSTFYIINDPNVSSRLGIRALGAHEYFHVVQIHLAKINYHQFYNKAPAWFIEGSCDFVGYLSASPTSTDYINQRHQMFSGPSLNDFDLSKYNNNNGELYPYDIGRAAIEYLVASKGFQPVMDTFIEIGNGQPFEQAFEKSFEIKLIDFYDKFKNVSKNINGLVK